MIMTFTEDAVVSECDDVADLKKKPYTRKPQEKHMRETLSVVLPKRALIQMFDTTLNAECI